MTPYERLLLPENLIYAWRKAKKLYQGADGYIDRAEIAAFELNLENELASIKNNFEQGNYKLKKLKPLPRPKKLVEGEAVNRQYYHVALRDQVAWIAVVNALGPELDQKMPSWSYGNRLYRPAWYEETDGTYSELEIGPYRHASGHLYKKFQHSWPLFRRHVSLTARSMVKTIDREQLDDVGDQLALASAEKSALPYTTYQFWPSHIQGQAENLYYASIDLEKFYPNIKKNAVLSAFIDLVPEINEGDQIVKLLENMLNFRLDKTGLPSEILDKTEPPFQEKVQGIPTGLFVSGFLANLVMLPIDLKVEKKVREDRNIAHFRFVDDHTIIAYDFDELCNWIDWYVELLDQVSIGAIINQEKYDPPALAAWINDPKRKQVKTTEKETKQKKEARLECQVDGRNPTKLLTKTLGQVSAIATNNVHVLADKDLEERLKHLEWLLLADIPEREIRPDTRAAFAAGQIAVLTPLLVLETNGLLDEMRKFAKLEKPDSDDEPGLNSYDTVLQNINKLKLDHYKNEKKRLRHCFHLLVQAFEEHPSKARLFYRLLQYCSLTGYKGIKSIADWIENERKREHLFWADYYSCLTLHIISNSLLRASSTLADAEAMWSERNAAESHIEDIANIRIQAFSLPKERQTWFHTNAETEFAVAVETSIAFLGETNCDPSLLQKLAKLQQNFTDISLHKTSFEWQAVTGHRPGTWLHIAESTLSDGVTPSHVWKKFEACLDHSNLIDRNATRRYPELISEDGWSTFLNMEKILKASDSGWLCEVVSIKGEREEQIKSSKKRVFRRIMRAKEACPKSHIKLSDWTKFIHSLRYTNPFDPRHSEWTALEVIRLIIEPEIFQLLSDDKIFNRIHPENILIPNDWLIGYSNEQPISWETWRNHLKQKNDVKVVKESYAILDYRYLANDKSLTGENDNWENGLHSIGLLLLELLSTNRILPSIWNIRGNEHSFSFPLRHIFSGLAISSQTQQILEGCLNGRSAESRAIKTIDTASLFGWKDGEMPNDTNLDPPLLETPNDLYIAIKNAQTDLLNNQIAVSGNQPRQLIPVSLEALSVRRNMDEADI